MLSLFVIAALLTTVPQGSDSSREPLARSLVPQAPEDVPAITLAHDPGIRSVETPTGTSPQPTGMSPGTLTARDGKLFLQGHQIILSGFSSAWNTVNTYGSDLNQSATCKAVGAVESTREQAAHRCQRCQNAFMPREEVDGGSNIFSFNIWR